MKFYLKHHQDILGEDKFLIGKLETGKRFKFKKYLNPVFSVRSLEDVHFVLNEGLAKGWLIVDEKEKVYSFDEFWEVVFKTEEFDGVFEFLEKLN